MGQEGNRPDVRPTPRNLAWKLLRHVTGVSDEAFLRRLLPAEATIDQAAIEELLDELLDSKHLMDSLDSAEGRSQSGLPSELTGRDRLVAQAGLESTGRGRAMFLYVAVRLLRPRVVVETGCFTGWDSAVLLQALDRNGFGHLYTIDLRAEQGRFSQTGPGAGLLAELPIGFLVPSALKDRWTLIEGDVRDELRRLLGRLPPVDLFFHDSDHSYDHMMWEFTTVWPHLAEQALVVSDDISWNVALWSFARRVHRRPVIHRQTPNVGALRR
jgi:predicted O-methyltransferase YrrM